MELAIGIVIGLIIIPAAVATWFTIKRHRYNKKYPNGLNVEQKEKLKKKVDALVDEVLANNF